MANTPVFNPPPTEPARLEPVAGLLACLFPGLGYIYLSQFRRAFWVAGGVLGLYMGGLLVGGISVVDRLNDRWWFYLQCGVGPTTFVVNHLNAGYQRLTPSGPNPTVTAYRRSLGRVYEVGALSAGVAGMMNLIAIVDCFVHTPPPRRSRRKDPVPTL
ncbi:MAG: hypothetical protein J0L61_11775 [Planctomycetes bacterium]|nr:hypothetical protein [Planctomycetota bacterium]